MNYDNNKNIRKYMLIGIFELSVVVYTLDTSYNIYSINLNYF